MDSNRSGRAKKVIKGTVAHKQKPKARAGAANLRVIDRRAEKARRIDGVARRGGRRKSEPSASKAPQLRAEILEKSFAALAPRGEELVERFYTELFRR